MWGALAAVTLTLPFVSLLSQQVTGAKQQVAALTFEARIRNLAWLLRRAGEDAAARRAEGDDVLARRSALALARATTATAATERDDRPRVGAPPPPATATGAPPASDDVLTVSLREAFVRAQAIARDDAAAGAGATGMLIAQAVALDARALAAELAGRTTVLEPDVRAALAATADSAASPPMAHQALPRQEAAKRAASKEFGAGWSPLVRDRLRARIAALAGERDAARAANQRLSALEETVIPAFGALLELLALAGLLGVGLWVYAAVRGGAAKQRGEPRLGWLRRRFPGLASGVPFPLDPLVPAIGVAAWLAAYLVAGVVLALLPGPRPSGGLAVLFQSLAGLVAAFAIVTAFARGPGVLATLGLVDAREPGLGLRAGTNALLLYCALLPAMLIAAVAGAVVSALLLPDHGPDLHTVAALLLDDHGPIQLLALSLAVVVVAPIGEEVLFRGFLYRTLRELYGWRVAIALSSLAFALLHLALPLLLPYCVLGLAFALAYEWTGSLWASITLHALWNAAVTALVVLAAMT